MSAGILWFEEIGRGDVARVGGKGASLGELQRAGIRVPPGFVVATSAFSAFMEAADPGGRLRMDLAQLDAGNLAVIERAGAELRQRVGETPLPAALQHAFAAACGRLASAADGFAVRSSATSEDSAEASFAGLQDTYLWVSAGEVPGRIRSCWASLYNTESISYRRRLEFAEPSLAMAVVVQGMVDARVAGVMFSRSPTTGDKSVVTIEASWGLGSSIVGGEVTPDKYVVNKITGEIVERAIASKAVRHVRDPRGVGVREEAVPAAKREIPCLGEREIALLTRIARQCEAHYGCPQDMEWCLDARGEDGEGALYLLQSRPETVWSRREAEAVLKPKEKAFEHVFAVLGGRKS